MKLLVFFLLFFMNTFAEDLDIIGEWRFSHYILDGQVYPAPNPDLDLRFRFSETHISTLLWQRKGDVGSCERKAHFILQNGLLFQKVFWVNPKNRVDCGQDPDMQVEKETLNHISRHGNSILIDFQLSDQTLTYVMDLITSF